MKLGTAMKVVADENKTSNTSCRGFLLRAFANTVIHCGAGTHWAEAGAALLARQRLMMIRSAHAPSAAALK